MRQISGTRLSVPLPDTISAISRWRGLSSPCRPRIVTCSSPFKPERLPGRSFLEYQRHHAHAHQIGAVDALEGLRDHGTDAEQHRAFRGPVARRAAAIFLAGEHHQRNAVGLVLHGRVVNRHALLRRIVDGDAAFDARHHLVLDADIGESAAHHHFMIAAARAVLVEVGRLHLVPDQIFAGRRVDLDRSGRRNVVGGDRVRAAKPARARRRCPRAASDGGPCRRNTAGSARKSISCPSHRSCRP